MELLVFLICFAVGWAFARAEDEAGLRCPYCGRRTCPGTGVHLH